MSTLLTRIWVNFLGLLLKFVHFVYSVFEYLDLGWLLLKRKYSDVLDLEVLDPQLFVSEFVRKLEKRPSHFVVIVGEDGINVKDFSNLVVWCLAAKISFLSFYDYSGYLKANQNIYYKHLTEKKKVDPKCLRIDIEKPSAKNGILHKIHLNILSLEDGKPLLVELSKKLSRNVISNKLQLGEINERLISDELYRFSGLPEPDLVLVSGKTFGTFGFLPWHIRVTEFLQISPKVAIQAKWTDSPKEASVQLVRDTVIACVSENIQSALGNAFTEFNLFQESKKLKRYKDVRIHFNAPRILIVYPEVRKMTCRCKRRSQCSRGGEDFLEKYFQQEFSLGSSPNAIA